MNDRIHSELLRRSKEEPFGRLLGMEVVEVSSGNAVVQMSVKPELTNIFGATHGGALFSLIDEAFQLACNTHGVLSVALNVSITYAAAPEPGILLEAKASEIHRTNRTASYSCEVYQKKDSKLIATAQALAYRTSKQIETP